MTIRELPPANPTSGSLVVLEADSIKVAITTEGGMRIALRVGVVCVFADLEHDDISALQALCQEEDTYHNMAQVLKRPSRKKA